MNGLNLALEIEGLAGSDVKDVVADMCRISQQLDIMVKSKVNGKIILARPWDSEHTILRNFEESWKNGEKYITGY